MIPFCPAGAIIDSLLLAVSRLDETTSRVSAQLKFYGARQGDSLINFLGRDAIKLSKNAFAGDVSPADLILKHSAWPVYSSLVSRPLAHNWYVRNVTGGAGSSTLEVHSPIQGELFAHRWRSCRLCAVEQTRRFGTAHWMVIHQLPGIYHCPVHSEPLDLQCGMCGADLGGPGIGRLPGEPCKKCDGVTAVRSDRGLSRGEIGLAKLYVSLLKGEGPELDPVSRHFLLKGNPNTGDGDSCRVTKEQVISAFGCSTFEEFGRYLNVEGSMRALNVALEAGSNRAAPAPFHLVVAAIALSELPGPTGSAQNQTNLDRELEEAVGASLLAKLPADIADEILTLAANQKKKPSCRCYRVSGGRVRDFNRSKGNCASAETGPLPEEPPTGPCCSLSEAEAEA